METQSKKLNEVEEIIADKNDWTLLFIITAFTVVFAFCIIFFSAGKVNLLLNTRTAITTMFIGMGVIYTFKIKNLLLEIDYRAMFFVSLLFFLHAFVFNYSAMWTISVVFFLISLVNFRKWRNEQKWSELSEEVKRVKIVIMISTILLFTASIGLLIANNKIEAYQTRLRSDFIAMSNYARNNLPAQEPRDVNVISPQPNEAISSPLAIKGEARGNWYFEAVFPIRLEDENGNLLAQTQARAQSDWMTENIVPFTADLTFNPGNSTKGFIILAKDNPSGLPENDSSIKIPVLFKAVEQTTVKIFFSKYSPDSSMAACDEVYAAERTIPKTEALGRAALEQLLIGPTEAEAKEYYTSINAGVKINSLDIKDGVASVDFDQQIQYQLGGSCRVTAIRTQITETLKQFPTVEKVIISVDGNVDEALQP